MDTGAAMKPWEQHHAVISMPRFAYNPASALQQNAGFLVTCTFRREKSATKEILSLIQEYINLAEDGKQLAEVEQGLPSEGAVPRFQEAPANSCHTEESRVFSENSKSAAASTGEAAESLAGSSGKEDIGRLEDGESQGPPSISCHEDAPRTRTNGLTLVKLATMGVIYICASCKPPGTVLSIASRIVKDVQAGTRAAPQWCHRIVPVQATCSTKKEELQAVVSQLVKGHLNDLIPSSDEPLNYAVAFNRRGSGGARTRTTHTSKTTAFGRDECIKIVTSAVEEVTTTAKVDLTSPQMVVSVELIPVAGSQSCLLCAVSVLPGDLIVSKPKINVKPLAPVNPDPKKRKHSR